MEDYKKIIEDIYFDVKNVDDLGKVANYIPELAHVSAHNFGIHLFITKLLALVILKRNFLFRVFLKFYH